MKMKPVKFDESKNNWLKDKRGISFEEIITAIEKGNLLEVINHPNRIKYKSQKLYLALIGKYVFSVPAVEEDTYVFFKTIYLSRKHTKIYVSKLKVKK